MASFAPDLPLALRLAVAVPLVLALPGSALLSLAGHRGRGLGRLALAVGLSVAVVPVAVLWWSTLVGRWSRPGLLLALAACAVVTAARGARLWQRRRAAGRGERGAAAAALVVVLATGVALRLSQAVDLVALPWVDGLHHTLMVQLFVDHGGVPGSYRPYLAVDGFYYHFGFHAVAAVVAVVADAPARLAALWLGQGINAAAGLATWLLARRLGLSPAASVWAAAVPTSLFYFPAYFLSWGRETQLAGLVALPAALSLLLDVVQPEASAPGPSDGRAPTQADVGAAIGRPRAHRAAAGARIITAAVAAAGLVLVHYRVAVFFALGALVIGGAVLAAARHPARRGAAWTAVRRLSLAAALAGVLAAPWLLRHLWPGVRHLQQAAAGWAVGPAGVERIEVWPLTIAQNALWLGVGAGGLVWSLGRRSPIAAAVAAWLALAVAAVAGPFVGLPRSWMLPPSALVISAFMPVALGVALAADCGLAAARRHRARLAPLVALAAVAAAWQAAPGQRSVVNPDTVLLAPADLVAMDWVTAATAPTATFLIGTTHWQFDTYRGVDGGYWLPLLAQRRTTVPPALYVYGAPDDVRRVGALAATAARGDALSATELSRLMDDAGADHVYVGAQAPSGRGFSVDRLRRQPDLRQVYGRDGVAIFVRSAAVAVVARRTPAVADSGGTFRRVPAS